MFGRFSPLSRFMFLELNMEGLVSGIMRLMIGIATSRIGPSAIKVRNKVSKTKSPVYRWPLKLIKTK